MALESALDVDRSLVRYQSRHADHVDLRNSMKAGVGLKHVTIQKYMCVFESLFLVRGLQPWFTYRLKRLTKSPKLYFLAARPILLPN